MNGDAKNQFPELFGAELSKRRAALEAAGAAIETADRRSATWPALKSACQPLVGELKSWGRQLRGLTGTTEQIAMLLWHRRQLAILAVWILRHPRLLWFRAVNRVLQYRLRVRRWLGQGQTPKQGGK